MKIQKIHIHGDDFSALLVAVSLSRLIPLLAGKISISMNEIETETDGATNSFNFEREFHNKIGLNENLFLNETGSSLHLATEFLNNKRKSMFCSPNYGFRFEGCHFHQLLHKFHPDYELYQFDLSAVLASLNKGLPSNRLAKELQLEYGYSYPNNAYSKFLLKLTSQLKIPVYNSPIKEVQSENGKILGITLFEKKIIEADIFIDCSKKRDIFNRTGSKFYPLYREYYQVNKSYIHFAKMHPADSKNQINIDSSNKKIIKNSWLRKEKIQETFSFSKKENGTENNFTHTAWLENCISIGSASTKQSHIVFPVQHLIQKQILLLSELLPCSNNCSHIKKIFNQETLTMANNIADIDNILINLATNGEQPLTENNVNRIELFSTSGHMLDEENTIISGKHWIALLISLGFKQIYSDRASLRSNESKALVKIEEKRTNILKFAKNIPPHEYYLNNIGI